MAANTSPIYSRVADVSTDSSTGMSSAITAAANDYTGVDADYRLVFTADGTNGSYAARLRFKSCGTNVATVARVFLNNGSVHTNAANNSFFGEVNLPATTASDVTKTADVDYDLNFALPAGFRIYVGLATAVADGWVCTCLGGIY